MGQNLFNVSQGVSIVDDVTLQETFQLAGTVDPSVAPGVYAPPGSIYLKDNTVGDVDIFQKFGPLDTDWRNTQSSATIGAAEDGTYTDGLFTDLATDTPIGTAVDRFNSILKALSPGPAPTLSSLSMNQSGVAGKLSFGASNVIAGYSAVTTAAGNTAADINDLYAVTASRKGLFAGSTAMTGTIASSVVAKGLNYPAASFGPGDQGTLELVVNGLVVRSVDLSSFASGNTLNANGSGFNLTGATSVQFADSTPLPLFKYRTGTYTVSATDQNKGFNVLYVNHHYNGSDHISSKFEWVNDPDTTAITATGGSLHSLVMSGAKKLSGVTYHTAGTAKYNVTVNNLRRDVYSSASNAIQFPGTNCTSTALSLGNIADETDSDVIVDQPVTVTSNGRLLNASIGVGVTTLHPLKTGLTNTQVSSIAGLLLDGVNTANTSILESFCAEDYRLVSTAVAGTNNYASQSDVSSVGNLWDSAVSLATSAAVPGYSDGLLVYNGGVRYLTQGINSGDFRNTTEGGSILNGPAGNPSYAGTTGTRTYYRRFKNNTGLTKANFALNFAGTGTFVSVATGVSGQNITAEMKFPAGSISTATGFLDMYADFATAAWADGNGCRNATAGAGRATGTAWGCTVGTKSIAANEYILVRITAPATWTGSITSISLTWL